MIKDRIKTISLVKILLAAILATQILIVLLLWQAFGGTSKTNAARDNKSAERKNAAVHAAALDVPAQTPDRTPAFFFNVDDTTAQCFMMQREIDLLFQAAFDGNAIPGFPFRMKNGEMLLAGARPGDGLSDPAHLRTLRSIEKAFEEAMPPGVFPGRQDASHMLVLTPALDMREMNDCYTVTMSLPGMSPSNVSVSIEGRMLTVTGRRDESNSEWYFEKRVLLPGAVAGNKTEALITNGMLKVTAPKAAQLSEGDKVTGIM